MSMSADTLKCGSARKILSGILKCFMSKDCAGSLWVKVDSTAHWALKVNFWKRETIQTDTKLVAQHVALLIPEIGILDLVKLSCNFFANDAVPVS